VGTSPLIPQVLKRQFEPVDLSAPAFVLGPVPPRNQIRF
jgi:hypothetical protein